MVVQIVGISRRRDLQGLSLSCGGEIVWEIER